MKYIKCWILAITILLSIFTLSPIQTISANMYSVPVTGTVLNQEDIPEEENTENFITDAIKSIDEQTAEKEKDKNYIRNFFNSAQTAMTEGLSMLHPSTIIMAMINMITMLIEMIMGGVTFIVMILYNFISTSFMSTMVQDIFSAIDNVMFDWSNPNSWIMKVLVITTLAGIGYQLVKNFTHMTHWKQIAAVVLSGFLSMSFIVFIGQNGRNIAGSLEQTMQSMIVQTFVFEGQDENMEIANKENIFDILQLQPFMLRHFGTASYTMLAERSNHSVDEAKARVQELLDHPDEDSAEKEYEDYQNSAISHDILSCSMVLFLSIITMIHRVLIGIVLVILCVFNGAVKLAKEILLALSIYQLIWWLIKRDRKAQEWFIDRFMWSLAVIAVDLIFSVFMYFILSACASISSVNALLLIAFDILLLCIFLFVYKRAGTIGAKLRAGGETIIKAMISGSISPFDMLRNMRRKPSDNGDDDATSNSNSSDRDSFDDDGNDLYDTDDSRTEMDDGANDLYDQDETTEHSDDTEDIQKDERSETENQDKGASDYENDDTKEESYTDKSQESKGDDANNATDVKEGYEEENAPIDQNDEDTINKDEKNPNEKTILEQEDKDSIDEVSDLNDEEAMNVVEEDSENRMILKQEDEGSIDETSDLNDDEDLADHAEDIDCIEDRNQKKDAKEAPIPEDEVSTANKQKKAEEPIKDNTTENTTVVPDNLHDTESSNVEKKTPPAMNHKSENDPEEIQQNSKGNGVDITDKSNTPTEKSDDGELDFSNLQNFEEIQE